MTPQVGPVLPGPLLGATAVAALLLVVVAYEAVGALVTLAHEGGHMAVNALTGRTIHYFEVHEGGSGVTVSTNAVGARPGSSPAQPATPRLRFSGSAVRPCSRAARSGRCCGRSSSCSSWP